jgi:transposase
MAENFINLDRNTPMLLPADLRDWVEENDLVHFILEVVAEIPSRQAQVNTRGTGSAQYPPSAMLALLLYCYSQGIYSSRKIERATHTHIGVRYLMANHHPDHDTIASFRQRNKDYVKHAFVTTVRIAQELGLTNLGTMAIDGTSLRANAGRKTSMTYDQLEQLAIGLCEERMERAAQADEQEQDAQMEAHTHSRGTIQNALAKINRNYEQRRKDRETMRAQVERSGVGTLPQILPEKVAPEKLVNVVDPDCHVMKMKEGYCAAGYNAQVAVDTQSHLITAALIADSSIDSHQILPVVQAALENSGGAVEVAVADAGYDNNHQIDQLKQLYGVCAVVAVKDPHRLGKRFLQTRQRQRVRRLKIDRIKELATPEGRNLMHKRRTTVETVFGTLKHAMKFREFLTRGRENVANEWNLVSAAYNLKRLTRLGA